MPLEDIADCLIRDLVAQVSHRSRDSIMSPTRILPRHVHNQTLDLYASMRAQIIYGPYVACGAGILGALEI